MTHPSRPCPVCAALPRHPLFVQRFAMIEGVSILDGYTVVACDACGATFADHLPPQAAFDEYYRESSKYVYSQRDGAESEADATRLRASAAAIARLAPAREARVVDVGCASGRLLAELRALGFRSLRGIDPSPECAAAARRIHGVETEAATLSSLASRGAQFDVVVLIGVLEHLVDVRSALADLRAVTAPGAMVYLEVPDVEGFAEHLNAPFQEFSVEHVNYFSLASLSRALGAAGFRVMWHEHAAPVQAGTTRVANLAVMAVRDAAPLNSTPRDDASQPAIERYISRCEPDAQRLAERMNGLVDSGEEFVLWGAGTLTLRLLATTRLAQARICAITDSNVRYHGRRVSGLRILSPREAAGLSLSYVVASQAFSDEITAQIQSISGPTTSITRLM